MPFNNEYEVHRFHDSLQRSLKAVERILAATKAEALRPADHVGHRYEDKYLLAEQVIGCGAASAWNCLLALGLTEKQYLQLKAWRMEEGRAISLRAQFLHTCVFDKEVSREEKSAQRVEASSMFGKSSAYVVTKITEYLYKFRYAYRLKAYVGSDPEDESKSMMIAEHNGLQICTMTSKSAPYPEREQHVFEASMNWLVDVVSPSTNSLEFRVDRSRADCHTPRRNVDVEKALRSFEELGRWCDQVFNHLRDLFSIQMKYTQTGTSMSVTSITGEKVFNPVLPVFYDHDCMRMGSSLIAADQSPSPPSSSSSSSVPGAPTIEAEVTAATATATAAGADGSHGTVIADDVCRDVVIEGVSHRTVVPVASESTVLLVHDDVTALVSEQLRSLLSVFAEMDAMVTSARSVKEESSMATASGLSSDRREQDVICRATVHLAVMCSHLLEVSSAVESGVDYIEYMLRRQLISAIGRELGPSDFAAYMIYHYRKLLCEQYQPLPFCHSIRRSATHSPEGLVRIDAVFPASLSVMSTGADVSRSESIRVFSRLMSSTARMEFSLSASTRVRCVGEQYAHCWLSHAFNSKDAIDRSSLPEVQLVGQARQFSSFIVLVGRMNSGNEFDPKHGFIVRNKEEWILPLLLEPIPTPKQFRDAIESLSPEQQRFAKAFRSMQLESTLFAVCVIQIKPQLEKVLNLQPDSLTKEIRLTEDLMSLFIDYQIPSDLLSFDGPTSASKSERLDAVRGHVSAMMEMIQKAKEEEVKAANQKREYRYGVYREAERCVNGRDNVGDGGALLSSCGAFSYGAAPGGPPAPLFAAASGPLPAAPLPPSPSKMIAQAKLQMRRVGPSHAVTMQATSRSSANQSTNFPTVANPPTSFTTTSEAAAVTQSPLLDVTKLPMMMEEQFSLLDKDNALRPTIINVGKSWRRQSQAGLLGNVNNSTVEEEEQGRERQRAFDLLDALTRSGGLELSCCSLHVVVATTHGFEESLLNTVVQKNMNPIERVERSALIILSTLHGLGGSESDMDEVEGNGGREEGGDGGDVDRRRRLRLMERMIQPSQHHRLLLSSV